MVGARRSTIGAFLRDRSGLAMTEALLVMPLLMLIFGTMIEFSTMMFQWNQTVTAMQYGARMAAVSDPLTDISTLDVYSGGVTGAPPPSGTGTTITCGAGASPCVSGEIARLYTGGDGICGGTSPLIGVCDIAPFIRMENLRISYHRSNLGYVGRPFGTIVTVTLELRNQTFDFFALDTIMALFSPVGLPSGIAIPPHPVSITSEDLCSVGTCP